MVSHSPYSIRTNCERAIWIEHGAIQRAGNSSEICNAYELFVAQSDTSGGQQIYNDDSIQIEGFGYPAFIKSGDAFPIDITLRAKRDIHAPILGLSFFNINKQNLFFTLSSVDHKELCIREGLTTIKVAYDSLPLTRGMYSIDVILAERSINNQLLAFINCYKFEVQSEEEDIVAGMFRIRPKWEDGRG